MLSSCSYLLFCISLNYLLLANDYNPWHKCTPFQYYLYVNAPTAALAYQSTLDAYQSYGDRQMLKAMNAISHQKIEALRLEEASQAPASQSATVNVKLRIYAQDVRGEDSLLGEKQFSLQQGKDKRYEAKRLLEGF